MRSGLETTMTVLASTRNEAATRVLLEALDRPDREVQSASLKALVERRSATGHRELLRRWHSLGPGVKAAIAEHGARISSAVREAVVSKDEQQARNGFDAALCLREFDLIPVLVAATEDKTNPNAKLAAETTLALSEALRDQLATPRNNRPRRDPRLARAFVLGPLEQAAQRFDQHKSNEIIESFLLLVGCENAGLLKILRDPHHKAYLTIVDLLTHSSRPGLHRLLLSFLNGPHPPAAVLRIISRRCDVPFVRHLLHQFQGDISKRTTGNLKRIDSFSWLQDDLDLMAALNEREQSCVVDLIMLAGVNRLKRFDVVNFILRRGGLPARRTAAASLHEFGGADANDLINFCTNDSDPVVQAQAVRLFRERGIPGAMQRLLECTESPHDEVRSAARESLSEFKFQRFLTSFDLLDDATASDTAQLVRRVDPDAIERLRQEFAPESRSRRLRALAMAASMKAVPEVEAEIIEMLSDPDHFMRAEAARALGDSDTTNSRSALRKSLLDRSPTVREAAERTLQSFVDCGQISSSVWQFPEDGPFLPQEVS